MKKLPHFPGSAVHALWMPLHADGKRVGVQFDRLDGSVLGAGGYRHPFSGEVHCLVMEAVYIETGTRILFQSASSFDADPVTDFAAVCRLLHMVQDPARDPRHVLSDRAAAGHA